MKPNDIVYLQHILDAIAKVEAYLRGVDEPAFSKNPLIQDGVIRQIEIIGEAAKHLSLKSMSKHPRIPWQDIAGMRDKLVHDYFGVDIETVWLTAVEDLPVLKAEVDRVLAEVRLSELRS